MRVLLTGQVGLDKGEYLKNVQQIAHERGRQVHYMTVGQKMIESYEGKVNDQTILNLPKALLDLLRRYAWRGILTEAQGHQDSDIMIVNSHAVFRWHHGMFPAIDLDLVLELRPNVLVVLIDDVDKIKERLRSRGTDFFELWELLAWREEEIWLTKFLGESLRKLSGNPKVEYFIVPRSQGPELLVRLLTEPQIPKVYLSFAVTGLSEDKKREIGAFKEEVGRKFIAFDPLAMAERSMVTAGYSLAKELAGDLERVREIVAEAAKKGREAGRVAIPFWDAWSALGLAEFAVGNVALSGRQVISVLEGVDSQIIARDFLLIDQSDFVLMYIRIGEDGTPQISAGSQSEMVYGYAQGKPVYIVCPGGRKQLSPWVTQFSEVFETLPEALDYLSRKYEL